MKNIISTIRPLFIFLVFSFVIGQSIIFNNSNDDLPLNHNQLEQPLHAPNKFNFNQGFTLSTSMSGGTSQTMGIYSNYSNFKLTERLQFNTGFHLFQNKYSFSYSDIPQKGVGYELGLEYKLSSNSIITIQLANYNTPMTYKNRRLLNAY